MIKHIPFHGVIDFHDGKEPSPHLMAARNFLKTPLGTKAIDFGCFRGRNIPVLTEVMGGEDGIIGIDIPWAEPFMEEARQAFPKVTFMVSPLHQLEKIPDGSVSCGFSWRVLHNITGLGLLTRTLLELYRILTPQAPFIIAVRAAHDYMDQNRPVPQLERTYLECGGEREDLYFTEPSLRVFSPFFTFHGAEIIKERCTLVGKLGAIEETNVYWMLLLTRH